MFTGVRRHKRSLLHFNIGRDTMPPELIRRFWHFEKACAW